MEAKRFIWYSQSEEAWEELAEAYQRMTLDEFVEYIREHYPHLVHEPEAEEVVDDVQATSEHHLLTWSDGMDEFVTIYERPSVYEQIPF